MSNSLEVLLEEESKAWILFILLSFSDRVSEFFQELSVELLTVNKCNKGNEEFLKHIPVFFFNGKLSERSKKALQLFSNVDLWKENLKLTQEKSSVDCLVWCLSPPTLTPLPRPTP